MNTSFQKIGIVGLGVMGGSVLLKLKAMNFEGSIFTVSRSESSQNWGKEQGATACYSSVKEFPKDLDLIILAVVSSALKTVAEEIGESGFEQALITDLASTKSEVIPHLSKVLKHHQYLSCHPMCGSEKIGNAGAKESLYESKMVILTPHDSTSESHVQALEGFWEMLGARTMVLEPGQHDQSVAWVSHMPHLVIAALVKAIAYGEKDLPDLFQVAGTGLKDISRLAASNPALWTEIVAENLKPTQQALLGMCEELKHVANLLENINPESPDSLQNYFTEAKEIHFNKGLAKE